MIRRRHIRPLLSLLLTIGLVAAPLVALAVEPRTRRVGVSVRDNRLKISFGFRDAFPKGVQEKLSSGLTQQVLIKVSLERRGETPPVAYWARNIGVTYKLWEEKYIVSLEDISGRRSASVKTKRQAVDLAGALVEAPITDVRGIPAGAYRLRVRIETNPVSKEMVEKIRQWLARSRASKADAPAPSNYFGSFVGALVDRRISRADHQIDFVSQWFHLSAR